jgi:tetrahydromethanopterin S-methyltransferase subunit C
MVSVIKQVTKNFIMTKIYTTIIISVLFISCSKMSYVGQTYSPTQRIDVYVTPSSISHPYLICGSGYMHGFAVVNPAKIQKKALKLAKEKGADAVLITAYYNPSPGYSINNVSRSDSLGKAVVTTKQTVVTPLSGREFAINFIKYIQQ